MSNSKSIPESIIYAVAAIVAVCAIAALVYYGEKREAKETNPQDPIVVALATAETGDILFLKEHNKSPQRILLTRLEDGRIIGQNFALFTHEAASSQGFLLSGVNIPYGNPVEKITLTKKNDYLFYGATMSLMMQEAIDYSQGER